jgi:hypothetical protein
MEYPAIGIGLMVSGIILAVIVIEIQIAKLRSDIRQISGVITTMIDHLADQTVKIALLKINEDKKGKR